MFNFFAKEGADPNGRFYITDTDFNHIKNVLRMKQGDEFLVVIEDISVGLRLPVDVDGIGITFQI